MSYEKLDSRIIRVHAVDGIVYARVMEVVTFPPGQLFLDGVPAYMLVGPIDSPPGLTQQGVVNHFRAQGWTVEQDNGTDFDHPQWGE